MTSQLEMEEKLNVLIKTQTKNQEDSRNLISSLIKTQNKPTPLSDNDNESTSSLPQCPPTYSITTSNTLETLSSIGQHNTTTTIENETHEIAQPTQHTIPRHHPNY